MGLFNRDQYIAISTSVISQISGPLPFDVYVKRAEGAYTKLFPKDEVVDSNRLREYQQEKGIESMYVTSLDFTTYQLAVEKIFDLLNTKNISQDEHLKLVTDVIDIISIELYSNHRVDEKTITHANKAIKGCVQLLSQGGANNVAKIFKFISKHPYMMKHSIMTSLFSIIVAKNDGINNDKILETIGLGGMVHDIGMSRVSFDGEDRPDLTADEWKEVKEHPAQGKKLLDAISIIPQEVKSIVLQHHEQPNGQGYPNRLYSHDIYRPSKMVAIADVFSSLVSKRPFREAFNAEQAFKIMFEDQGKYDLELLKKFARFMGHF